MPGSFLSGTGCPGLPVRPPALLPKALEPPAASLLGQATSRAAKVHLQGYEAHAALRK